MGRAFFCGLGLRATLAQREAGQPADREQRRDEDELAGRVARVVVDHDRRGAEHDGQADAPLCGIAEAAEQERGEHPGDLDTEREYDQAPVHEGQRRGPQPKQRWCGEWEATAPKQGQHDKRDRGRREPVGRARLCRRVVPEDDLEGGIDRHERDEHVESVTPRQRSEPSHEVNVPQRPTRRLRPK